MPLLILVAEDDPAMRLSISDYLEFCGYSVIAAEDGQQALSLVEKYHPHLLISDIKMPKMNGYELVKSIRKLPQYRLLPVILLTECNDTVDRILGYQMGCDMYLPKPFEIDELKAIVRNLLERSQVIHSELRFSRHHGFAGVSDNSDNAPPTMVRDRKSTLSNSTSETANYLELDSEQQKLDNSLDLTKREQEVLEQLVKGHSNIEIGEILHLSHRTVEKYVSSLLRKSELNNRIELVRYALKHHLVS